MKLINQLIYSTIIIILSIYRGSNDTYQVSANRRGIIKQVVKSMRNIDKWQGSDFAADGMRNLGIGASNVIRHNTNNNFE